MQTLGTFLGIGKSLTMLVAFLYRTIASAYTSMLQLIDSYNGSELQSVISTLVDRVYVLVCQPNIGYTNCRSHHNKIIP